MSDQQINYKKTLNLPQTDFPMRGGLPNKEPKILAQWENDALYERILARRKGSEPFILHDGPPYANGNIHHGHVLNKVLKDFVVKYKGMAGFYAPYVPGWDCHGLPIEHKVDQQLGKKKREMSQVEIRKACRAYADEHVSIQRDEFKRVGVLGEWADPYLTMTYQYEAQTVRVLGDFFDAGIVYKGLKPVHWSWAAQTALADAEVEYDAYTAPSCYAKFNFDDAAPAFLKEAAGERSISVVIWTTTPWTLPANLAICLNPEFKYELLAIGGEGKHSGQAIILAEGLKETTLKACKLAEEDIEVLASFDGSKLVGHGVEDCPRLEAKHPFIDRGSVLLPADYVTLEQGTGCVHTAPGHGADDFNTGRKFGLDVLCPVNQFGKYNKKFEMMEGEHVFKANPRIMEMLDEQGALLAHPKASVKIERYPHCWRTKKPIIFRATEQWFVSMDAKIKGTDESLRDRALRDIDKVQWVPSWGKDRILGMMEGRPDWCISRQRLWGVPITVFYCDECDTSIAGGDGARHVAELAEEVGYDVWFERSPEDLVPEGYKCPSCGAAPSTFRKEGDILDVWFDSGVSWSGVLEKKMGVGNVADLYLEGSDQHRGWFNSSLLCGVGTRNAAPYKTVLTHGFVCDDKGHKYSKSSKNFVPPAKMINVDGADILRLWVAAVDYRGDITLSPQILKTVKDAYRKLRNTSRFLLGTVADFDPNTDAVAYSELDELDRWALSRTHAVVNKLRKAYDNYEFHTIYHGLIRYATVDLSNTYLNTLKDRLYAGAVTDKARRASQTVLYEILQTFVRLMAPILAFTAEEIWGHLKHREGDASSVHLMDFPAPPEQWSNPALEEKWDVLLGVRTEVDKQIDALRPSKRGEREAGQIGASEEAVVVIKAAPAVAATLRSVEDKLAEYFIVSKVSVEEADIKADGNAPAVEVTVTPSAEEKCPRCWRYPGTVGQNTLHPLLCSRCAEVLG